MYRNFHFYSWHDLYTISHGEIRMYFNIMFWFHKALWDFIRIIFYETLLSQLWQQFFKLIMPPPNKITHWTCCLTVRSMRACIVQICGPSKSLSRTGESNIYIWSSPNPIPPSYSSSHFRFYLLVKWCVTFPRSMCFARWSYLKILLYFKR